MPYLLHQLLETSTRHYPNKTAIFGKDRSYSYQELEAVSNQVAHVLKQADVKRGDRVGLYLNKSIEAVAALFGVLKAGAAYVPLDPSAPARRIAYIIDNCAIKALVATRDKIAGLGASVPSSVQCVMLAEAETTVNDALSIDVINWSEVLEASAGSPPDPALIEDDLAYILYTSGSTGVPKGVMISHRAALTFVN